MFQGLADRVKGWVNKKMRLCFLCPFDFREVPCGLDGQGYPFVENREWVKKLLPVLQVRESPHNVLLPMKSVLSPTTTALECNAGISISK